MTDILVDIGGGLKKRFKDMGDGTVAEVISLAGGGGAIGTISGLYKVAQTLTFTPSAGYTVTAGNWTRDGVNISGATGFTYQQVTADVGHAISYKPTTWSYSAVGGTTAADVPGTPSIAATAGNASIGFTITPNANDGGSAVLDYIVSAYKASDNSLLSTKTVTTTSGNISNGIANGVDTYLKVISENSVGPSALSLASNIVTPQQAQIRIVTQNNGINSGLASASGMDMLYAAGEGYIGSGAVKSITPRVVGAWYVNGTTNTVVDAPQGCTLVGMVLEDTARTRTVRVTFSGAQSKAIAAGDVNIVADAINAAQLEPSLTELPQGYHFWWKATWQVPAKGNQICGDSNSYVTPSGQRFWRASDDATNVISSIDTPGYFTATSGSLPGTAGASFIPQVVFTGVYSAGDAPAWAGVGDSILVGVGDTGAVTAFGPGYFRRALRGTGAVNTVLSGMCLAVGGLKLSTWLSNTKITQWLAYLNRANCELGTNDFGSAGAFSSAAMTSLDNQLYDLLGTYGIVPARIIKQDLLPNTTGAFVVADGSDQTIVTGWGPGGPVNTYRSTLSATVGVKVASVVGTSFARNASNDDKWVASNTSDGKHPNTNTVTPEAAATRTAMLAVG